MTNASKRQRQIFVLTLEEKKVTACVVAALLLGLATKHYRDTHPPSAPQLTEKQQYAALKTARAATARARSAHAQTVAARGRTTPSPPPAETEEDE